LAKKRKAAAPAATDTADQDDPKEAPKETTRGEPDSDELAEALKRYRAGWEKDRHNQELAYQDLRFLADEGQWEDGARAERVAEGRPILVVNKCPQFVRQVTGDIRQLRPAVKVVPVDDAADKDVAAKILPGMLRYIEQRSDAKAAYFSAADQMVGGGIGHCRVYTEYAAATTFDQEICVGTIEDGIAVVWDPDSTHPTRKDAMWCFVPFDYSRDTFKARWPDASPDELDYHAEDAFRDWLTGDTVRVSEYWRKVPTKRELALYPEGELVDLTDDDDGAKRADAEAAGARIEKRDSFKVERILMTASSVLEGPDEWPGVHIPIVPFMGEEVKIGRRIERRGIIRTLKDVQRVYNYAVSAEAEVVALQPKAPFVGTRKNFEKYLDEWETANKKNWPFLQFEPDGANGGAAPQRVAPPVASTGILDLRTSATNDMHEVTGIYPASLGAKSNEASGRAILARQREGDTGTYVYIEAFGRAVQRVGEIIVDLIPHIYDTERTIRIVGEDGKVDAMAINQEQLDPNGDGIATLIMNDLTIGAYEVMVEMGASYATKREEARDGMTQLLQAAGPETLQLFLDLFVKQQDWPLADKIAKRAELLLPAPIRMAEAAEAGEPPPPMPPPPQPPPPTPEQQLEAQKVQAQHEMAGQELQFKQASLAADQQSKQVQTQLDQQKLQAELAKVNADLEKARMTHEQTMAAHAAKIAEHNATTATVSADPRYEELKNAIAAEADAIEQLKAAVVQIADSISAHVDQLAVPPEPPFMSDLRGTLEKLANQKRPTGIKRTPQGMQLVFDEATPTAPASGAPGPPAPQSPVVPPQ
jgi:hypothetical protein